MTRKPFIFLLLTLLILKNAALDCEAAEVAKKDDFWQDMRNLSMSINASSIQNQDPSEIIKAPPTPELPIASTTNQAQDTEPNPQNISTTTPPPTIPPRSESTSTPTSTMKKLEAPTLESLKSLKTQAKSSVPKESAASIDSLSLPTDPVPPAAANATEEEKRNTNITTLDQKITSPAEQPKQSDASPAASPTGQTNTPIATQTTPAATKTITPVPQVKTPTTQTTTPIPQVKTPVSQTTTPATQSVASPTTPIVTTTTKKELTDKKATSEKNISPEKNGTVTPEMKKTKTAKENKPTETKPTQSKTEKKAQKPTTKPKVIIPANVKPNAKTKVKPKDDEDNEIPKFALPDFDDSKDKAEIDVISRKPYDYQNQVLPPNINKKRYGPQNQHIPKVFYQNEYSSLLFVATKGSDIGAIKALLSKGADINAQDMQYGYTPLMYAIIYNKLDSFRYLITNGADIQKVAYDGRTPLHVAALYDRLEMFKILVSVGANLFAQDNAGLTAYEASGTNSNAIAMTLASQYENMNQALLDCAFIGATACVQYAINKGANINHKNMHGDTALTMAINKRHSVIISILIANGANVNQRSVGGLSAKDLAYAIGDQQIINAVETAIVQKELQDLR